MSTSAVILPSTAQMLLGLYAYLLPTLLYVLWTTLALWDLGKRDLRAGTVWGWTAAIFIVPFVAPVAYLVAGGGQVSSRVRLMTVGGGIGAYVVVLLLGSWSGMT